MIPTREKKKHRKVAREMEILSIAIREHGLDYMQIEQSILQLIL